MAESNFETKLQTLKNLKNACAAMTGYDPVQDLIKISSMERSEEHTSELQSHSFISYAVFCLKKKKQKDALKRFQRYLPYY